MKPTDALYKPQIVEGSRSPKTAEEHYWAVHEEIRALHAKKGADYGRDKDPLANLRAAEDFGFPAWVGVALRMRDKMHRIQTFVQKGVLANESIEDAFLDMANYAMLGLALYREGLCNATTSQSPDAAGA